MDIISHGLWGGIAFGRKNKQNFLWAFLIGIAPDLFSFGISFVVNIWKAFFLGQSFHSGKPDLALIPNYVFQLYNVTHSLIIFALVFGVVWAYRKKTLWLLGAWGLHILVDIPTHGKEFFPTPFLWPVSNFTIDGINWGNPIIFFPNLALLFIAYIWFYIIKNRKNK